MTGRVEGKHDFETQREVGDVHVAPNTIQLMDSRVGDVGLKGLFGSISYLLIA